jgi:hypothetical protein
MKSEMFANRPDRKSDEEVDSLFDYIFEEEDSWAPKLAVPIAVKVGTSEIPNVSYCNGRYHIGSGRFIFRF